MKIIITESQYKRLNESISLKEKLKELMKKTSFKSVVKIVGSLDKTLEIFDIKKPMDFLNLFNDLDVVQGEEVPEWTLYRYKKGHNLILYNKNGKYVHINYYEIWSVLEDNFGLSYTETKELAKRWLDETYKLKDVQIYANDEEIMRATI
jgi:hypothetical protein